MLHGRMRAAGGRFTVTRAVNLRLPEDLAERVRGRAAELGQTQTEFFKRALEAALGEPGLPRGRVPMVGERVAGLVKPASALVVCRECGSQGPLHQRGCSRG